MYRATVASALIAMTSTSPKIRDRTVTPLSVRTAGSAIGYVCSALIRGWEVVLHTKAPFDFCQTGLSILAGISHAFFKAFTASINRRSAL